MNCVSVLLRYKFIPCLLQEALKHLASINLRELCNEAKIERCRATRDLTSCGRFVHHVLNPCGHASLCTECCQRCDICPLCRSPLPINGDKLWLRLYYECVEAGLISRTHEEASQDSDEDEHQLAADVLRLYSLFDVAMNNNLISVVCHCILLLHLWSLSRYMHLVFRFLSDIPCISYRLICLCY